MPPLEESDMHQEAVYWTKTGLDRYNNPVLGSPVEIICRWVNKRGQTLGPNGTPIALDAIVVVPVEIREGTLMWEGKLSDWNPALKNELMEVVTYNETPSINARFQRYQLGLKKFKQTLPS